MGKWSGRLAEALLRTPQSADEAEEATQSRPGGPASYRIVGGAFLLAFALLVFFVVSVQGDGPTKFLDAFEFYYPSYNWLYGELASGRLPLWNPYQLCGIPTLGTLQPGLLYPPHLLYVLLPTDLSMAASGFLHLMLIGITTLCFGLRAGLSPAAAWLAAALISLRGALPGHLGNPSMLESGAWLALGFLGVLDLVERRPLRGSALLALSTGMSLLAGFPQFSVYAAYAWGFLLLCLLVGRRRPPRRAVLAVVALVGAVGLGVMLAAVALLPALELTSVGARERGILPLGLMLGLGAIGFEKPSEAIGFMLAIRPALPAVAFTFGWVGLLLLPFALAAPRLRALTIALALLGGLTFGFALGPATPLFDLYLALPELGTFRNPWRILYITDFCFAIAAGIGLDGLLRLLRHVHGKLGRLRNRPDEMGTGVTSPFVSGRPLLAVSALFILVLALGELFLAKGNEALLPYDRENIFLKPYHQERRVLSDLADGEDRVFTLFVGDMGDVSEKLASLSRIRSISDYEIMTLQRQREYFSYLFWGETSPNAVNREGHSQKIFYGYYNLLAPGIDPKAVASRNRLVDLAAARHLLVPRSGASTRVVRSYLREAGLRPIDLRDPQIMVFENARALPRAYVTHRVEPAPGTEELLAKLASPDFDPREQSYLELDSLPEPELAPAQRSERVAIVRDTLHEVTLEVELDAPGVVILSDSYYPGWHASVDGESVPIYAANHLFRGVAVGAGVHEVRFLYEPSSVRIGAGLSLLGVVVLVGLFVAARREGRDTLLDSPRTR